MRQLLGIIAVIIILITAPMWLKGVAAISNAIANSFETVGIAQQTSSSQPSNWNVNVQQSFDFKTPYLLQVNYSNGKGDQVMIDANESGAQIGMQFGKDTWQQIQDGFMEFLNGLGFQVNVKNK